MKQCPLSRYCALCEFHIEDGDAAVFVAEVRLQKDGEIKYSQVDLFHKTCWDRAYPVRPLEVTDETKRQAPSHDSPPDPPQ